MTADEIRTIRNRFASSDMRLAKKKGHLTICGSLKGNVDLSYDAETKTFIAETSATVTRGVLVESVILFKGTSPTAVKLALGDLYIVDLDG